MCSHFTCQRPHACRAARTVCTCAERAAPSIKAVAKSDYAIPAVWSS